MASSTFAIKPPGDERPRIPVSCGRLSARCYLIVSTVPVHHLTVKPPAGKTAGRGHPTRMSLGVGVGVGVAPTEHG
jgi:hypothetical protein